MKKSTKIILIVIAVVAIVCIIGFALGSSNGLDTEGNKNTESEMDNITEVDAKVLEDAKVLIEADPAQKEGYETFVTKLPLNKELKKESDKQGTVVEFTYETRAYALEQSSKKEEIPVTKMALVYLPYGYDETKTYDILYLMHGGGECEYYWLGDETMISGDQKTFGKTTRNVLDNMIASGLSKEVIVVAPTFYTEVDGNNAYVDGDSLCIAFAKELREDLIPAIETSYSTYAKGDISAKGLQASRDHRAFAGFSMGSFTTIQAAMMRNLDIFSYFGALSGSLTELPDFEKALDAEEYKDLPIHYMYNGNGTNDIAHDEHKELCINILAKMSDRFVDGENFAWIDYEGGYHAYNSWITDLHNCLTVFFQ